MTKKDYIKIAKLLNIKWTTHDGEYPATYKSILDYRVDLVDMFAEMLQADNPRFDKKRFVTACHTE